MPQVPYNPTVAAPAATPPNDYQQIQANPSDFGGQVGQAAQQLGAGIAKVGQVAQQFQDRYNQIATDDGYNKFTSQALPILNQFKTKQGADAMAGAQPTLDQIEQMRLSIKNQLPTQAAQLAFETQSRRFGTYLQESIGSHAAQQQTVWNDQTQKSLIETNMASISADPFNDKHWQNAMADIVGPGGAVEKRALAAGASPETLAWEKTQASRQAYAIRAQAMGETNPAAAMAFMDGNRAEFDPGTYHALQSHFEMKADGQAADALAAGLGAGVAQAGSRPAAPVPADVRARAKAVHDEFLAQGTPDD